MGAKTKSTAAKAKGPGVKKPPTIDLTQPNARKALAALHPAPTNDLYLEASPEAEEAAAEYFAQRAAESSAKSGKELAGTQLCAAIGKNLGVRGDGWKATWGMRDGEIDWRGLAKAHGITDEQIETFRRPPSRSLDVREVADGAE